MKQTTHTPGPWHTPNCNVRTRYAVLAGPPSDPTIVAVCEGDDWSMVDDEEQIEANARLIAAAPCLLAICERALAFMQSMSDADNVELTPDLRAAIAKATGGQS